MTRIRDALDGARRQGLARLDAQLLLAHALARPRAWLLAHDDAPLAPALARRYAADCVRRAQGVPLAYLTGESEFHGLPLVISPAVLVPRPETELLVEWALEMLAGPLAARAAPAVVDLGTGSGALALAVARACPRARVAAVDLSAEALAVARHNGAALGLSVDWRLGSWWQPLGAARFDLALSNPPYVAEGDPHLAALRHEPASALLAGPQGLDALRAIVAGAAGHLQPGGWLLFEHGHDQAGPLQALMRQHGFVEAQTRCDLAALPRCTGARWPEAAEAP